MADSIMLEEAKNFAVEIVKLCKMLRESRQETVMTYQLIRSGTSIGANIHESKYGNSTADFIFKMQLALKECYETEYWLELLNRTGYITNAEYQPIQKSCGNIRRMLISSIKTVKEHNNRSQ